MDSSNDITFMQRALELAEKGRGYVSPNPMVGCVIVYRNKIIGEGWHDCYGGPHAEVNAVNSITDSTLLPESTCYVTLEPCAHYGKTPPCAAILVSRGLKRVVVATKDPNPLVSGKGIVLLEAAGITVTYGVLEEEARRLNCRFFTAIEKQRPYIILKWAETADGFIARKNYDSKWISNEESRVLVHKWRAEEDAIMVGTRTASYDNPMLNVREQPGKDPLRIVIDKGLNLPETLHLFDQIRPTVVYSLKAKESGRNLVYVKLPERGFLRELMADLHKRKVRSVLVEGGASLMNSLIDEELWDEARVFTSNKRFNTGIFAPVLKIKHTEERMILTDELKIYHHG